ncbi:MAG: GNAT family N-acetyltransferase [Cyanobacteria bacterium J06621_8]
MNSKTSSIIKLATSDAEIEECFPILSQLRNNLPQEQFVHQVKVQMTSGYQLSYIKELDVLGVAGFKIDTSLSWSKYLYIADLVIASDRRSQGYGTALFDWLTQYARQNNCQQLHLDSGVQRFAAHRFYFEQKMHISSHHFTIRL